MESPPSPKKRRIPKACMACRTSKVKCDGGKPCTRCRNSQVRCDFTKPVKDAVTEKLAEIEQQMMDLSRRVPDTGTAVALLQLQQNQQLLNENAEIGSSYGSQQHRQQNQAVSPVSYVSSHVSAPPQLVPATVDCGLGSRDRELKRKRENFHLRDVVFIDVISKGIISLEDGDLYFKTFFQGCHKFVPIFDSSFDTFESIRSRSPMLFDTICAVGCRAEHGPTSQAYQSLSNTTKDPISAAILGTLPASIETVQALLVDACYSEKGWLMTSLALKMALELGLPDAYSDLCARVLENSNEQGGIDIELFRKARVWFGVFVLEHILSIDCGKRPGIHAGLEMRRCRVLLNHPARLTLDFRLLSQVELNSIRALAHDKLFPGPGISISDDYLNDIVQGTRIDLGIWLGDWISLVDTKVESEQERASLTINLKIQRYWSEMTMLCKGLQGIGVDNVAYMSDVQQHLIQLAKESAQQHLAAILENPRLYLASLRYGMDFVWAKCAFSVLLLLKLARLIPGSTDMSALIMDSKNLLRELSQVPGFNNIYFRILSLSVEKCEKALRGEVPQVDSRGEQGIDAETDFQSYVPKEFILEWNFPGLTFCWVPFDFEELFMDFGSSF